MVFLSSPFFGKVRWSEDLMTWWARVLPRALPTAGGACDASVEVTMKSVGFPPRAQWLPAVTGSDKDTV